MPKEMSKNKESHWYALVNAKCPHCHTGNMFINRNPYALNDMAKMPKTCPACGQNFFPETGFYWGSMYMSYAITILFSGVNIVLIGLIFGFEIWPLVIGNAILLALGFPLFFRFARVIWLQVNVPFSKEACERAQAGVKSER